MSRYASWLKSRLLSFGAYAVACAVLLACTETASAGEEPGPCEMDPCLLKCDPCGCCDTWNPCDCQTNTGNCPIPDQDGDGVPDCSDNCPTVYNPDQEPCACGLPLPTEYISGPISGTLSYSHKNVVTNGAIHLRGNTTIAVSGGSITIAHSVDCQRLDGTSLNGADGTNGSNPLVGDPVEPTAGQPGQPGYQLTLQTTPWASCRGGIYVSTQVPINLNGGNGGRGGLGDSGQFLYPGYVCELDYLPAQDAMNGGTGGVGGSFMAESCRDVTIQGSVTAVGGCGGDGGSGGGSFESHPDARTGLGGNGGAGGVGGAITIWQTTNAIATDLISISGSLEASGGDGGNSGEGGSGDADQGTGGVVGSPGGSFAGIGNNGAPVTVTGNLIALSGSVTTLGGDGGCLPGCGCGHGGGSPDINIDQPCEWVGISGMGGQGGEGGFAGAGGTVTFTASQPASVGSLDVFGTITTSGGNGGSGGNSGRSGWINDWQNEYITLFDGRDGGGAKDGGNAGAVTIGAPSAGGLIRFGGLIRSRGGNGGAGGGGGFAYFSEEQETAGGDGSAGGTGGTAAEARLSASTVDLTVGSGGRVDLHGGSGGDGGDGAATGGCGGDGGARQLTNSSLAVTGTKIGQEQDVGTVQSDGDDGTDDEFCEE